ncbi:calcium-binding protein [Aquitalea sp. ASV11]|uniref:calcium-binding protein n=1 Tax=Aquitalea sp. ASV11 TaxID=2795103 RepID=UPI0018EE15D4|nr:calcium-binding protein [Aquitalea sp. ASV11]
MSERKLTNNEISMLKEVYGNSIDYSKIVINTRLLPGDAAVTTFNTISFPDEYYKNDYTTAGDMSFKGWLVHEVAHIWQWQVQGKVTILSGIGNWIGNGFSYDKNVYNYSINDDFNKMNIEQMAAAITDRFLLQHGLSKPYNCTDCTDNPLSDGSYNRLLNKFDQINSSSKAKSISSSTSLIELDSNQDGKADQLFYTFKNLYDTPDQYISTGNSLFDLLSADRQMRDFFNLGLVSNATWNDYTNFSTSQLVCLNPAIYTPYYYFGYDPIGAFYESKAITTDNAASIAKQTFRVLDSNGKAISAAQLLARDSNKDGKLSGAELDGLTAWQDGNEDGVAQTGENITLASALSGLGLQAIRASDVGFYTASQAQAQTVAQSTAVITDRKTPPAALGSNYSTLRNTDNRFWVASYGLIYWASHQVKISSDQRNLIGTEGNDSFDINYYAEYNGTYFNLGLIQNFYAGGGNDLMGGSDRNDNLWGGTGHDVLLGYAGDDRLYGEEGDDALDANAGNDLLDGGSGNDKLFGGVGNDILIGGDGNDFIVGFTAGNDSKQTLDPGESDDDVLFGGAGNDILLGVFGQDYLDGGSGDDDMDGGAGNDVMDGGSGADNMFGGVGDDRMWGGDGDDFMQGFTAADDSKQTLATGETDNDVMYGGAGNDVVIGGLGHDQLWGGTGNDELQGDEGDDWLYGEAGNDRLFGGAGDDVIYGGDGDDLIVGGMADNETPLPAGARDNNFLYGGAGNDTIIGGIGNDYIDGGAGADGMEGGKGNDTYIVNSVNDVVLEQLDEGYDTVVSSVNYILNANIEELRLLEGYTINGTGNSLDNLIIGNSQNNILDGVTGADTMIGGLGNDIYYVDNAGDKVIELAGEGVDTVYASISYALGEHVENLTLLDFAKPEKGLANGVDILVYGYPKANELDYMQGNAVPGFRGTCALTSIANLAIQANIALTEGQVVQRAIDNQWCVTDPVKADYQRGGTNYLDQQALLDSYGIRNGMIAGYNEQAIANLIKGGRGVIIAVNSGQLWDDADHLGDGNTNHVVTVTGVACDAKSGEINGFYIADSGRGLVSDMTRYIPLADFRRDANVSNAYAIYTIEPIKLWEENINATGNALDNQIIGNRGDNVLTGGKGNDTLIGQAGNDRYVFNRGDGQDLIIDQDATVGNTDTLQLNGINQTDLWFAKQGMDLQIQVLGSTDRLTIKDWYTPGSSGTDNQIERIQTADGRTLYNSDVAQFVQAMSAFAPPAATQTSWVNGQQSNGQVLLAVNH